MHSYQLRRLLWPKISHKQVMKQCFTKHQIRRAGVNCANGKNGLHLILSVHPAVRKWHDEGLQNTTWRGKPGEPNHSTLHSEQTWKKILIITYILLLESHKTGQVHRTEVKAKQFCRAELHDSALAWSSPQAWRISINMCSVLLNALQAGLLPRRQLFEDLETSPEICGIPGMQESQQNTTCYSLL